MEVQKTVLKTSSSVNVQIFKAREWIIREGKKGILFCLWTSTVTLLFLQKCLSKAPEYFGQHQLSSRNQSNKSFSVVLARSLFLFTNVSASISCPHHIIFTDEPSIHFQDKSMPTLNLFSTRHLTSGFELLTENYYCYQKLTQNMDHFCSIPHQCICNHAALHFR